MVTVILPTASRPALLFLALQSVACQTALPRIGRVYVSENGADPASRAVCRDFPQLPITYLLRDPALPPLGHAQALMKECLEGEVTCILHDDDVWLPGHLERALAALQADPEASAYGANYTVYRESALHDSNYDICAWFGANYPSPAPVWRLTHANVLLASLFGLVIHYSSIVTRTAALAESAYVYGLDNPFDNDRMLLFALSRRGPVLFGPEPSVIVRHHPARETTLFSRQEREQRMARTTEWMIDTGLKSWSVVAAAFAKRLAACPEEQTKIDLLRLAVLRPWCLPEIARHLDRARDKEFFAMYDQARALFGAAAA